ncbi:MAG: metal-dependent transcriptional regulator [Eubacteriales bacterium]|jgi:DtxR family Mn-dependent transcriptional regulator|nr:metal-dependent transcriptional regulator [Eubacteriales bacterium]
MKIQQSAEDYFETIFVLKSRIGMVRSIDIVNELGYSKPTVSIAMKKFKENGYITMDEHGYIELTDKGLSIAKDTYEKHNIIAKILMGLGVSKKTAYEDACRIEHHISDESFLCMKKHYDTFENKK